MKNYDYKELIIWVEGEDDEFFLNEIIKNKLEELNLIVLIRQIKLKKEKISDFIKSIRSTSYRDYLFITDIDKYPCITKRKRKIKQSYKSIEENKIIIVIKEIEGWYIAGLENDFLRKCGFKLPINANEVTKELFNSCIENKKIPRYECLQEIVSFFSIERAKRNNKSFNYFSSRFGL